MSFDALLQNGDIVINGDIEIVEDTDKLLQDAIKLTLTPLGSVSYDSLYGTQLSIDLIGNALPSWISEQNLTSSIIAGFQYIMNLQRVQVQSGQFVSDAERLVAVEQVQVLRDETDPRQFNAFATLVSKNGQIITHRFTFNPMVSFDSGVNRISEIASF